MELSVIEYDVLTMTVTRIYYSVVTHEVTYAEIID